MNAALEVVANGVFWLWLLGLLPAALVSILKGRLLMFATGWLTLGVTWFIAAFWRADPHTWWAQRFYGDERMARAAEPLRHRVPARVAALWIGGAAALVLAIGAFTARPAPILGLDGHSLQHSVWSGTLGDADRACRRVARDEWLCAASVAGDSSGEPYRVKTRGLGCWRGTPVHGARPLAGPISGCITIWDELRPF